MSEPLKPCPFCGSTELDTERDVRGHLGYVECRGCHAQTGDSRVAIAAWNRRVAPAVPSDEAVARELERLRAFRVACELEDRLSQEVDATNDRCAELIGPNGRAHTLAYRKALDKQCEVFARWQSAKAMLVRELRHDADG